MKQILCIIFALVLALNIAHAFDVETYGSSFHMVGNKIVVDTTVVIKENVTEAFEFEIPEDYEGLSVYIDGKSASYTAEDSLIKVDLNDNYKLSYTYVTKEFIDKTNFLMNLKLDFDAENVLIKLVLPEGASLKKPMKRGDLTSGSIYPKPAKSTTDGRSLIFYWLEKDIKEGDEISIFAQVEPKRLDAGFIILGILIVLVIAGIFGLSFVKKMKTKIIVKKEDMYEKHLKEDEEQIINVLKQREGHCEQGTLRIVTGFPKATLSRLLSELEARNIIYKEKRGKKNVVFLKK